MIFKRPLLRRIITLSLAFAVLVLIIVDLPYLFLPKRWLEIKPGQPRSLVHAVLGLPDADFSVKNFDGWHNPFGIGSSVLIVNYNEGLSYVVDTEIRTKWGLDFKTWTQDYKKAFDVTAKPRKAVTVEAITDADFAYFINQSQVVAVSQNSAKFNYRIIGVTEQGSCAGGCPPSQIYISVSNYYDYPDGHVRLFKIDGLHFYSDFKLVRYDPSVTNDVFLVFRVQSTYYLDSPKIYEVSVSPDNCSVKLVS